jgi:hypothetical protein
LLASFLCSILSGDVLVEPGEFSLHRVQPVIASHQLVYVQSTSDASVEIPVAKERRREAYNKQAGSLNMRMSPSYDIKNNAGSGVDLSGGTVIGLFLGTGIAFS